MSQSVQQKQRGGIIVPPLSKVKIAEMAGMFRKALELDDWKCLPIIEIYEVIHVLIRGARFEVVEDDEIDQHKEAETFPDKKLIRLRNSVYDAAARGDARCRFTMSHELGHLFMHTNISLPRDAKHHEHKIFENSEWQADTFASYLLMPDHLLIDYSEPTDVMEDFGVSYSAAQAALDRIREKRRYDIKP